jgi:hypothetical protein
MEVMEEPRKKQRFTQRALPLCTACGKGDFVRARSPFRYRMLRKIGIDLRVYQCFHCKHQTRARVRGNRG